MENLIQLPSVTDDFDGQTFALDQAIREAAATFNFHYLSDAPGFTSIYHVPDLVYKLVQHYTMRGFLCTYDGEAGKLKISWDFPNMSWLEQREITRSIPEMIPNLGIGFRAGMLYLCMTNGTDLRGETDATLQSKLGKEIKAAATLGNLQLSFGFPSVPAPAIQNLFAPTFQILEDAGFEITYSAGANIFLLKWGTSIPFNGFSDSTLSVDLT
jgi:hypothetical protein